MVFEEQYRAAERSDRRLIRRERAWRRLAYIALFLITAFLMCLVHALTGMIPKPVQPFFRVLVNVGLWIIEIVSLPLSAYFSYVLTLPLWKKVGRCALPAIKKEILSKAAAHLREYYDLNEPCLLTKCYDASDEKWKDHDVCIFIAYDELRITTDLKHGFIHGERDLGCYAFRRSEISLSKCTDGKKLIAELRAADAYFMLGYRAKGFIEKNFIEE